MTRPAVATEQRVAVVFGSTGQVGEALVRELTKPGSGYAEVRKVHWADVSSETKKDPSRALFKIMSAVRGIPDFVFACGLTDPKASMEALLDSNFEFPKAIIQAGLADARLRDSRMLTFGSIHERFPDLFEKNAYLRSKVRLVEWIEGISNAEGAGRVLHLRLHTLYGGKPNPRMFLGQMIRALNDGRVFEMSSGDQLREYMHVEDAALAIRTILGQPWNFGPVLELSSGEAVSLADIARAVFQELSSESRLKMGSLQKPAGENTDQSFTRTDPRYLPKTRPTIPSIVAYVKACLGGRPKR